MGYLRRVLCVTLRDKEHRSEIRKAQDVKPLLRIERSQLIPPCVQNVPGKNGELSPSGYFLHPQESGPKCVQGPCGVTTSPTSLGSVLVWNQQNYL